MTLVLNTRKANSSSTLQTVLNYDSDSNTLEIYDIILNERWYEDQSVVTPRDITDALRNMVGDVTVRINSRGGEVGAALTIYNRLKDHTGKVTTVVDGYAFSSAGWIAQAGEQREIANGGIFMLHNPQMLAEITSEADLETAANQWKAHRSSIMDIFTSRISSLTPEEVSSMMEKETYFSATEAVDKGFFDTVHSSEAKLATLNYAPPAHIPDRFLSTIKGHSLPENVTPVDRLRLLRSVHSPS